MDVNWRYLLVLMSSCEIGDTTKLLIQTLAQSSIVTTLASPIFPTKDKKLSVAENVNFTLVSASPTLIKPVAETVKCL